MPRLFGCRLEAWVNHSGKFSTCQVVLLMPISARLKESRAALGLTQTALADALGVTKWTIINWENGTASPNAEILAKYAAAGVDILYVITGQRIPHQEKETA